VPPLSTSSQFFLRLFTLFDTCPVSVKYVCCRADLECDSGRDPDQETAMKAKTALERANRLYYHGARHSVACGGSRNLSATHLKHIQRVVALKLIPAGVTEALAIPKAA